MVNMACSNFWSLIKMLLITLVPGCFGARPEYSQPNGLPLENPAVEEVVSQWGYPIETHRVVTEDGYILTVFRLPKPKSKKFPVFLQHGILSSSPVFLANKKGLPYFLFDNGHDVWVGNARGTQFSQGHKTYRARYDAKFWDFSFHEMGYYDIPAVINYIRLTSDKPQLHYVGHSMGTTMFLVMAYCRPEFQESLSGVILMAPVARPKHMGMISGIKGKAFSLGTKALPFLGSPSYQYANWLGQVIYNNCGSDTKLGRWCRKNIAGEVKNEYDSEYAKKSLHWFYDGTSFKNHEHFLQIAIAGRFQQYDYGEQGNRDKYGRPTPPKYKLRKIDQRICIFSGGKDTIADKEDVVWLQQQLKRAMLITDKFENFGHSNFNVVANMEVVHQTVQAILEDTEIGMRPHVRVEVPVMDLISPDRESASSS